MRPTRKMGTFSNDLRFFKCIKCFFESEWVDKPELDGSFCELHKKNGSYLTTSMMSDPAVDYGKPSKSNRKRKVRR